MEKAAEHLGYKAALTGDRRDILSADHIILPGVGSFGKSMGRLNEYGLSEVIREAVSQQIPFLGICLGLQLLFEESDESPGVPGLGLLPGKIRKIPETGLKVPHIGWNSLTHPNPGRMFKEAEEEEYVYFVHSYYLEASDTGIVTAATEYATHIHAAVEKDNIFAVQFHPEKSSDTGLKMLRSFLEIR